MGLFFWVHRSRNNDRNRLNFKCCKSVRRGKKIASIRRQYLIFVEARTADENSDVSFCRFKNVNR